MLRVNNKPAVRIVLSLLLSLGITFSASSQDVSLKIHLEGVHSSKISLLPLAGPNALKPMIEKPGIKRGEVFNLTVPKDMLPGEFVLRFDYQDKEGGTPYPSEKYIFINSQNLELWVKPKSANNPDSTRFQNGERENALFAAFSKENTRRKEQLALLQNFLMAYDQPQSEFYNLGIEEYESRRIQYNQWVVSQVSQNKDAFVSSTFPFQYVQPINWKGKETERMQSLIAHYFDGMDFKDPLLVKTSALKDWMNKYVNLYGAMSTTIALRDSLFTVAGRNAIEKAKTGHPLVYGWMVDYFYKGYEGFNIASGVKMLEPYLQDPRCLTTKRLAIEKRLQGIETLIPGALAPDFLTKDDAGKPMQFHDYKTNSRYKLVLFWSADCMHCKDLVQGLQSWYEQIADKKVADIFAISVDFTDTEIKVWEEAKAKLKGWRHSRAEGGINSKEANAYFILATPVMILVDSKTNKIVAMPDNITQLKESIK